MMGRLQQKGSVVLLAGALALGLAGCSVHPLPEDVTGVSTVHIVERIRCEVKQGLDAFPASNARAKRIIDNSTVGFEFDFIMNERSRVAGGELTLERKAVDPGKGVEIALTAGLNDNGELNERANRRVFRVFENLKDLRDIRCDNVIRAKNRVYPIAGDTGMAEVVRTYINLELITDLEVKTGSDVVFSDDLSFTTIFSAGAMPDLTVDTAVGSLRITKVSVTGAVRRSDVHNVTIALSRDAEVDVDAVSRGARGGPVTTDLSSRSRMADARRVADKGLRTSLAKQDAGSRNRVLIELQRRRNLREDDRVVTRVLTGLPP